MDEFLSDQWFEDLNSRLATSPRAALPEGARPCEVVFEVTETPSHLPAAFTLSIVHDVAVVSPGSRDTADTTLRLGFDDAAALAAGRLDSACALREGRIKVRGDVNVLVPLVEWLHALLNP